MYSDFTDGVVRKNATEQFKSKINVWIAEVKESNRDVDKEKTAINIIVENTLYGKSQYDQSAYSLVCDGKTVCAGYAAVMQILLNAAGVETLQVTSSQHAWNIVKLHGYWYQVDPTWADAGSQTDYVYFNKSYDTYMSLPKSQEHVMEDRWDGYIPELKYDAGKSNGGRDYSYQTPYFMVDGREYFTVNVNTDRGDLIAEALYESNEAEDIQYPEKVTYNKEDYSVIPWCGVTVRNKEVYDPETDAWYWLDNIQGGAKAVSKDVYQESSGGKWVRYDADGHMVKGWRQTEAGTYTIVFSDLYYDNYVEYIPK